jgi:hypothetical protein
MVPQYNRMLKYKTHFVWFGLFHWIRLVSAVNIVKQFMKLPYSYFLHLSVITETYLAPTHLSWNYDQSHDSFPNLSLLHVLPTNVSRSPLQIFMVTIFARNPPHLCIPNQTTQYSHCVLTQVYFTLWKADWYFLVPRRRLWGLFIFVSLVIIKIPQFNDRFEVGVRYDGPSSTFYAFEDNLQRAGWLHA